MTEIEKIPETNSEGFVDELQPGTPLMQGQYNISRYLNAGGFGITYLANDSLSRQVVVKECFPSSFCRRSRLLVQPRSRAHTGELRSIVRLFTREAQALAKLQHPNIVSVHQVFEANNTAYMVIDFIEGHDLLAITKKKVLLLRPDQIKLILRKTLGAIGCVHDAGLLHRDISPDNIIINADFEPVLIDFGAAREQATKATQALSAMRVVKDGYSPQEFYIAGSQQGPESDLYSLAATFYYVITREIPPDSQKRIAAHVANEPDPYVPLARKTQDYDPAFCDAIDKAMAILPKDRIKSAKDWLSMLDGKVSATETRKQRRAQARRKETKTGVGTRTLAAASFGAVALLGLGWGTMFGFPDLPTLIVTENAVQVPEEPVQPSQVVENVPAPVAPSESVEIVARAPQPVAASEPNGPLANVPTSFEVGGIASEWTVRMPFTLQADGQVGDPGNARWLTSDLHITDVNGSKTVTADDVVNAAIDAARRSDGANATLRLVATSDSGTTVFGTVEAPVAFDTILPDGTRLRTQSEDGEWETAVTEVGRENSLRVGDVVVGLLDSPEWLNDGGDLARLLAGEIAAGRPNVRFAVRRAGTMWVEPIILVQQSG